jgi:two-component system chemotaxis response regulator CheB
MPQLRVVVIGGSAGGLDPLLEIVEQLPNGLPVCVLVVLHTRPQGDSYLPTILRRQSRMPVAFAVHGEPPAPGRIYVAPPDAHLLMTRNGLLLSSGPRENGFRPAIDPLFRTAARIHRGNAMGVILSGGLDDGTYGLKVIKDAGGTAVVQDPTEARIPTMPRSAIRVVAVDHVLKASAIGDIVVDWASRPAEAATMARKEEPEPQDPSDETDVQEMQEEFGSASGLTCPDCGGALWQLDEGRLTRYRCHVGHQYTIEGLDAEQHAQVEAALWTAVRVLEEHADLRQRMARRADASGLDMVSQSFAESARDSARQAHTIRELLYRRGPPPESLAATNARAAKPAEEKRKARRRVR